MLYKFTKTQIGSNMTGGLTIKVKWGDKENHEVLEQVGKSLNFTGCGS